MELVPGLRCGGDCIKEPVILITAAASLIKTSHKEPENVDWSLLELVMRVLPLSHICMIE